jgi:hypothetical protein
MMNIQPNLTRFRTIFKQKTAKKGKNTEGGTEPTVTNFNKISGNLKIIELWDWLKRVKFAKLKAKKYVYRRQV